MSAKRAPAYLSSESTVSAEENVVDLLDDFLAGVDIGRHQMAGPRVVHLAQFGRVVQIQAADDERRAANEKVVKEAEAAVYATIAECSAKIDDPAYRARHPEG